MSLEFSPEQLNVSVAELQAQLQAQLGQPIKRLMHNGVPLAPATATLAECHVASQAEVTVVFGPEEGGAGGDGERKGGGTDADADDAQRMPRTADTLSEASTRASTRSTAMLHLDFDDGQLETAQVGLLRDQIAQQTGRRVTRLVLHGRELVDDAQTLAAAGFISSVELMVDFEHDGSDADEPATGTGAGDGSEAAGSSGSAGGVTLVEVELSDEDLDSTTVADLRQLLAGKTGRVATGVAIDGVPLGPDSLTLRAAGVPAVARLEVTLGPVVDGEVAGGDDDDTQALVDDIVGNVLGPRHGGAAGGGARAEADAAAAEDTEDSDAFVSDTASGEDENTLSVEMEFGDEQLITATVGDLVEAVQSQLEGRSIQWVGCVPLAGRAGSGARVGAAESLVC